MIIITSKTNTENYGLKAKLFFIFLFNMVELPTAVYLVLSYMFFCYIQNVYINWLFFFSENYYLMRIT